MTYIPNSLNAYDTYTYNVALYMVRPSDLSQLDGAISNGVLIANNAVEARYNLSNVEQIFTMGHNVVRETFANRFQITIQEPNGVTLLSKIQQSAATLGIPNHLSAGYIICIEFNGRRPDGAAVKHPQVFYYPVQIVKMDFKVTEGGTTYNIDAVENSSNGYRYLNTVIRDQITIVAETVGEFVDLFQEKYNESLANAWAANPNAGVLRDTYSFEFDETTESWRDWRFQALDDPYEADGTNFIGVPGANPKLQVVVNNGSNITSIFGQVLQLTAEYKRILTEQGEFFRQQPSDETSRTLDSFPTFFKMITNVEYGDFDPLRGEYQKNIVYKLKAYTVTDELLDLVAYQSSITNTGVQSRRVQNLIANNFMKKRYDYYYTGLNTEIMEFDMQFDHAYYYATPYGDGYYGDPNVQNPQYLQDQPEVIARLQELATQRQTVVSAAQSAQETEGIDILGPNVIESFQQGLQNEILRLEELTDEFQNFLSTEYEFSNNAINHQVRFMQDAVDDQDLNTSDNDRRSGALKFGSVKMNLESSADLIQIELGIRGDPYWMGVPNSLYNAQRNVDEVADYEAGSISFFLNVFFPISDENNAGQRPPQPDYQLSGVYTVRNVINQFRNGQFVQYLSAVRDQATNTTTVYDVLSGGVGNNGLDRATFGDLGPDPAQIQEDAAAGIIENETLPTISDNEGGPF